MKRLIAIILSLLFLSGCTPPTAEVDTNAIYKEAYSEGYSAGYADATAATTSQATEAPQTIEEKVNHLFDKSEIEEEAESTTAPQPSSTNNPETIGEPTSKPTPTIKPTPKPTATPKPKPANDEKKSEIVYITKSGKKYHRDGCQYLSGSKIAIELDKAVAKGYTPCSKCW